MYDIDDDEAEEEEEDGLEGDFEWAVGPEPPQEPGLVSTAQGPGITAAQGPGLEDDASGIRLNNVWHDPRVQGDFSLWKTGPRLTMPTVSTPTPTTTTATGTSQPSQNITSAGTATTSAATSSSNSIYTYYTGLKDRLGDTNLGQAACSNTPLGAITYQVHQKRYSNLKLTNQPSSLTN